MGLRDRIEELRTNNEKRRIIKEINKNKNFDKNISIIINKYLDEDELFRIMLDNLDRIDESLFEEIIEKLSVDTILNNDVLLDRVCIYYSKEIEIFIKSPFDIKLIDKLNMLIENDKFKSKINEIIDIESLGEEYYTNRQNFQIYNHNPLSKFEKVNELLSKLGFKIDDDCIFVAFIYGDAIIRSKLMELDKINENVVDRLYEYKFRYMHYLYIPTELVPSSNNEFANYWRDQSIALGEDALSFVFDRIKDFKGYDIFSEKSREQIYNDWLLANENWIKSYDDVQKEFNESFDEISGRLFDNKGIPLKKLFSNEYKLHLSHEILWYNFHADARYEDISGQYKYKNPDYKLIKFLINNMDKIPEEYRFIFEKLKELEKIEDVEIREKAQMEFLLIMTGGERIYLSYERLYDENGFNDKFYDALFNEDKMEYIDYYAPDWKTHCSNVELIWMEKYKDKFDLRLLKNLSYIETRENLKNRELINYFFNEFGPTDKFYELSLFDRELFYYNCDLLNHYQDDKKICNYIKYCHDNGLLNLKNINEVYEYFNELGPTDKLYDISLCRKQIFEIFFEKCNLLDHYKNDKIITIYILYCKKFGLNITQLINSKEKIYEYFDEVGPNKKFYDKIIFEKDFNLYMSIIESDFSRLKEIYDSNTINYIKICNKYGKVFNFITKDNILTYFTEAGVTENFKNYFKENKGYTKNLIYNFSHNDRIINSIDEFFVNIFEYYIIDNYFNNCFNPSKRYKYLLINLGPNILFHLDDEKVKKLISFDDIIFEKFMNTIKSCSYNVVPNNDLYQNVIISLCNFTFRYEHKEIVNMFVNINSILLRMIDEKFNQFINNQIYDYPMVMLSIAAEQNRSYNLALMFNQIKIELNCSKNELIQAIIECRNSNESKLREICNKYRNNCEEKYLRDNKDTVLSKFGIPIVYDRDDSIKKLLSYFKGNINFNEFLQYRNKLTENTDYLHKNSNEFIESLNMTKGEYDVILSINNEEFDLIMDSIKNKKKPDNRVISKIKIFNRFTSVYTAYKFDNENIDSLLHSLNVKRNCKLELQELDMFEILKGLDLDIFESEVLNDDIVLSNLKNLLKNKYIGRLPSEMNFYFKTNYDLDMFGGINNIGLFLTKYAQILEDEKRNLKRQGKDVNIKDINFSFSEVLKKIAAVNGETKEIMVLFGRKEYKDFVGNAQNNAAPFDMHQREEKIANLSNFLYTLDKVTIPSKDTIIEKSDKKINFIVGNRTNASNICHGERTGACMRVGGVGEGLFLKCITDKNWFHIRIEDPDTHEYISRVSGFRKGNTVYLNQLRDSADGSKYSNTDLQEFITIYAKSLIEETKNSKYPIENVFINTNYAMLSYNDNNGKVYALGYSIQKEYNLEDVKDYRLRNSMDIWTDVKNKAILLATTEEGKKTEEGYVPFKGGVEDTEVYNAVRDKIYGIDNIEDYHYVKVDNELLMEKVNRVHAMKEKLLGKDYRYEIEDALYYPEEIIDGYASSDFYVYIDSNNEIHNDYIENIRRDNELIPYGQAGKAKEEMERYIEILKNRYMEVRHVI